MSEKFVAVRTYETTIMGRRALIQEKLHTKNPEGERTIRTKYLETVPAKVGGWMAGTETEKVLKGPNAKPVVVIPEHRVA